MQATEITQIIDAAKQYMADKNISQSALATHSKVSGSYLSAMMNGKTAVGDVTIDDKYWLMLSKAIGSTVGVADNDLVWEILETPQYKRIMAELVVAKGNHRSKTIIGAPGSSKTVTIKKFKELYPRHTYVVTINSLVSVGDILQEIMRQMDMAMPYNKAQRLYEIIVRLRDIKMKGGSPIIIFDEAENMEGHTMKLLKGMFDGVEQYASIVLVGTKQLVRKMTTNKVKDRDAAPQFYRRFYPGIKYLDEIDRKFRGFYERYDVPVGLRELLSGLCENYGELNAYLEPVLRDCKDNGVTLTEEAFRLVHNMPKYK